MLESWLGSLREVRVSSLSVYFTGLTNGQFYRDFFCGETYHRTVGRYGFHPNPIES